MRNPKQIIIIGAGFAGITAAAYLAKSGHKVTVLEKNSMPGGRAQVWKSDGFVFDMGPSWYWMPDVFESFFKDFGHQISDFYHLKRLSPSYQVFTKSQKIEVPSSLEELYALFERLQPGSTPHLKKFLSEAQYKYEVGMRDYVVKPSHSIWEFFDFNILKQGLRLQLLGNMRSHVRQWCTHPVLQQILEFPVLFLGATPQNTPALYSLMNYADLVLGTWYPMGGMAKIVEGMVKVAENQGVVFKYNSEVKAIHYEGDKVVSVTTDHEKFACDVLVSNADYTHTDQKLLPLEKRNYTPQYWEKRTMSPSSLLFYIGINKKLKGVLHHNLFFDEDFDAHAHQIYTQSQWPEKPLFYVCCPSQTDASVAPEGYENLFFLVPLAPGLQDNEAEREKCFDIIVDRFEKLTGETIKSNVVVKRSYAMNDFENDYHAYKGNAYGLANTLAQTAFLKPKLKSKHLNNMYFTGQLTVPGPGVPPAIISGRMVAKEINNLK